MTARGQREAAEIREEWLGRALCTSPADRLAAEAAIGELYALIGLAVPRFHWVSSPLAALMTIPPGVRPRPDEAIERVSQWPVAARLSALRTDLCRELDALVSWVDRPMDRLIRRQVRGPLSRSTEASLVVALRAAHDPPFRSAPPWYETQCVSWVAHYEAFRRTGVRFAADRSRQLDLWATLARSCGWWWPREGVCVISDRPATVRTEAWGDDGEIRLHCSDGPAIRYRDGWETYAWHGTPVPFWVVTDPSVRRIAEETNVEVRRCAIENLGWAAYIEQAGLRLVARAPDPGNPGAQLRLYDHRKRTRLLLAVNGSVERDGRHRQYGLAVPRFIDDPVAAAGWTYGLSAEQYSLLLRRT